MNQFRIKGCGVYRANTQPHVLEAIFTNRVAAEQLARSEPCFVIQEYSQTIDVYESLEEYGKKRAWNKITNKLSDFELGILGVPRSLN